MYKSVDMSSLKINKKFRWYVVRDNFFSQQECDELKKMIDEQSELFVYYAGHGLNYQSDNRLLAADFDVLVIQQTSLLQSEFMEMIAKANPQSVTIIFDTCFSAVSYTHLRAHET